MTEQADQVRSRLERWLDGLGSTDFERVAAAIVVEELCGRAGPGVARTNATNEGQNDGTYDFDYRGSYAGTTAHWRGSVKRTSRNGTRAQQIQRLKGSVTDELGRSRDQHWLLASSLDLYPTDVDDLRRFALERGARAYESIDRRQLIDWGLRRPWLLVIHGFNPRTSLRAWPAARGLMGLGESELPQQWEELAQRLAAENPGNNPIALSPWASGAVVLARAARIIEGRPGRDGPIGVQRRSCLEARPIAGQWNRFGEEFAFLDPERHALVFTSGSPPADLDRDLEPFVVFELHARAAAVRRTRRPLPVPPLRETEANTWFASVGLAAAAVPADLSAMWEVAGRDPAEAALLAWKVRNPNDDSLDALIARTGDRSEVLAMLFALAMAGPLDGDRPDLERLVAVSGLSADRVRCLFEALEDEVLYKEVLPPLSDLDGPAVLDREPSRTLHVRPVIGSMLGDVDIPRSMRDAARELGAAIQLAQTAAHVEPLRAILNGALAEMRAGSSIPPNVSAILQARAAVPAVHPLLLNILEVRVAAAERDAPLAPDECAVLRRLLPILWASEEAAADRVVEALLRLSRLSEAEQGVFPGLRLATLTTEPTRVAAMCEALSKSAARVSAPAAAPLITLVAEWLRPSWPSSSLIGNLGVFQYRSHAPHTEPAQHACANLLHALLSAPDGETRLIAWRAAGDIWREPRARDIDQRAVACLIDRIATLAHDRLRSPIEPEQWAEFAEIERAVLWFATRTTKLTSTGPATPALDAARVAELIEAFPTGPFYRLYRALFNNDALVVEPRTLAAHARVESLTSDVVRDACARLDPVGNRPAFVEPLVIQLHAAVSDTSALIELLRQLDAGRRSQKGLCSYGLRGELRYETLTALIRSMPDIAWAAVWSRALEDLNTDIREVFLEAAKEVFAGRLGEDEALDRTTMRRVLLGQVLIAPEAAPSDALTEWIGFALAIADPRGRAAMLHRAAAHESSQARRAVWNSAMRWANELPLPAPLDAAGVFVRLVDQADHASRKGARGEPGRGATDGAPATTTDSAAALLANLVDAARRAVWGAHPSLADHWRRLLAGVEGQLGPERLRSALDERTRCELESILVPVDVD